MKCEVLHRHKSSTGYDQQAKAEDDSDDDMPIDQLLSEPPQVSFVDSLPLDLSKPTATGITMQAAQTSCLLKMKQSSMYEMCFDIVNMNEIVESCAFDVMVSFF